MFGPSDAFLTPLLAMLRRTPVFPMFGSGATRLQPAYVEDVAEAVVRILERQPRYSFMSWLGHVFILIKNC